MAQENVRDRDREDVRFDPDPDPDPDVPGCCSIFGADLVTHERLGDNKKLRQYSITPERSRPQAGHRIAPVAGRIFLPQEGVDVARDLPETLPGFRLGLTAADASGVHVVQSRVHAVLISPLDPGMVRAQVFRPHAGAGTGVARDRRRPAHSHFRPHRLRQNPGRLSGLH